MTDASTTTEERKTTVRMPEELYKALRLASAIRSNAEGERVAMNELMQRGIRREVAETMSNGDYRHPEGEW